MNGLTLGSSLLLSIAATETSSGFEARVPDICGRVEVTIALVLRLGRRPAAESACMPSSIAARMVANLERAAQSTAYRSVHAAGLALAEMLLSADRALSADGLVALRIAISRSEAEVHVAFLATICIGQPNRPFQLTGGVEG